MKRSYKAILGFKRGLLQVWGFGRGGREALWRRNHDMGNVMEEKCHSGAGRSMSDEYPPLAAHLEYLTNGSPARV